MRLKLLKMAILTLIAAFATSCADATIEVSQPEQSAEETATTRGLQATSLSEETILLISRYQSDPEIMLAHQIVWQDSLFILSLSRDDAHELQISDSLYTAYQEYVEQLNNAKNE